MLFPNVEVDSAKTNERKTKLEELYREFYCDGKCIYSQQCENSIHMKSHEHWIRCDWSARVGENYDISISGKPVRIMIIGKEGTSFSNYTNKPSRWWPEINRHYKFTYNLLKDLLSYYPGDDSDDIVLTMFTLSNTYSCAFRRYEDQTKGIKNTDIQKKNCSKLRKKEIEILEPTLIVIQYDYLKATDLFEDAVNCCGKVYYSAKSNCYIIESSHPSCRRHPWKSDLDNSVAYVKKNDIIPAVIKN